MRQPLNAYLLVLICAFLGQAGEDGDSSPGSTADWPQWRGINRDGISLERNLLSSWPDQGPAQRWRVAIGEGYSAISVVQDRLYTMYNEDGVEYAACFSAADGLELWRVKTDDAYRNEWGNGPRSTPTVSGGTVYVASAWGKLYALDRTTGDIRWEHNLPEAYEGRVPQLGYSNSPLVYGDLVLLPSAGAADRGMVAFAKDDGQQRWIAAAEHPGYSSAIVVDIAGVPQLIQFSGTMILALAPQTGQELWRYPWTSDYFENVATPVFIGANRLFFSCMHPADRGSVLLAVDQNAGEFTPEVVWKSDVLKTHFSSTVLHGNYLYGTHRSILKCIDHRTGEMMWQQRGFGEGTLIMADGHLYVMGTRGKLGLVEATPTVYTEKGSLQMLSGRCYTAPSIAGGYLYARSMSEMVCLDIRNGPVE